MIKPRILDDEAALQSAVTELLLEQFQQSRDKPFAVMLSGGSTPLPIYQAIAAEPCAITDQLHICFSDERIVPTASPESNYGHAKPMLDALGVPDERVFKIDGDETPIKAAYDYDAQFKTFIAAGGSISLGLLGLGPDGHTASLFTRSEAARQDMYATPVARLKGPHRVSVTSDLLAKVERILFITTGFTKRAVVEALLEAPDSMAAGVAVAGHSHVEIWMDREAADQA